MEVHKGYHCAYQIHYHIVFPVKYRKALLSESIVMALQEIAQSLGERYAFEIEQMGCDQDHIHLLCSLHPKYAPGQFVQLFKSNTARQLFARFPDLKRSYGAESSGQIDIMSVQSKKKDWSVVEKYIRNQDMKPQDVQLRLF